MSLWNIDWKEVTIWWLVCILVFGIGYAAGAYDGKHAADLWWQANANDMVRAALSTKFYEDDDMSGTFCGDNSGRYTMKDGLCVSGDCFGKPQAICYEPKWTGTFLTLVPCPKEQR